MKMISCFGKPTRKSLIDLSQVNTLSKEGPPEGRSDSKKSHNSSSSEREHNFLRAAHNGNFLKVEEAVKSNMDVNSCNSNGLNALHLAAKGGHAQIVQFLIDHGANINAKTRKNNTAIHIASLAGCLDVVKILVAHQANVNEQSQNGFTPLYMAAQENHVDVVRYLLDQGADTNLSTTDNFTPLAVAIQQGHDETVSLLLDRASSSITNAASNDIKLPPLHIATRKNDYHAVLLLLHHQDDIQNALTYASTNGFTALHVAAYYGSDKVGRLLLENGAPVNCTSKNNVTPLHVAAKWNRTEMVMIFLEFEAKVDVATRDGIRPLHCAAREGNLEICKLLVEKGAGCDAKTKNGLTPLHMVAQGNHENLVDFFLKQKSTKINDMSLDYMTPLHIASHCNNIEVAQKLLKRGANINQRALNGFVALHIATKQNHIEFVKMLISNKCVVDIQTEMGLTSLHIAAVKGSVKIVQLLIDDKCDLDIVDQHGRSPLHLATIFDQYDVATCLVKAKSNINKQTNEGQTPLILAIKRENPSLIRYFLDEGADLSLCDSFGLSALHWAVLVMRENMITNAKQSLDLYTELLSSCSLVDINRATSKGITPLHLAAECGNLAIVKALIDHGAEVNVKTLTGVTPLHLASKNNHIDVILCLLDSLPTGSVSKYRSFGNWTSLHFAAYFGSYDALTTLISYEKENGDIVETLHDRTDQGNTCLHFAVQQIRPEIVETLLNNSVDVYQKNKNEISAINLANIINDREISGMIGLENLNTDVIDDEKMKSVTLEEVTDDDNLDSLLLDTLNELEFCGVNMDNIGTAEIQKAVVDLLNYSTTSESIRRADWSLKLNDSLKRYRHVTLSENKRPELLLHPQPSSMFSTLSSRVSEDIDAFDVEKCDHQRITDHPINTGFLVSFLVDARGGYMQAQRLPQLKIFVPPDAAPSPTRIICHLLKPERLNSLPELNDCDGFASRILQIHSSCPRFQKPILIEVPHIASLRNGEREIVTMRKNYDSQSWKEHSMSTNKDTLKEIFGEFYDSLTPEDELESHRVTRIVTSDIPNYFCLVSRFQRDSCLIGQEGGSIDSKVDSRIKIRFPPGALMKKIQISLEVQCVDPAVVTQVLGDTHQVTVSPIITVEPKRRKFRDLIEIQMPLPKGVDKSDISNLRILFSISEFVTKWEDVTNSTELTLHDDYVSHSTKISARVWLISAPGVEDVSDLANKIYAQHCCTPYIGRFLAYARRHDSEECQLRLILITDDSADKTLECQESFELIATGPEVEIINKLEYQIETAGNLVTVTKSDETIQFPVQPFLENRLTVPVRMRNHEELFSGKVAFIPDFKPKTKQVVRPITTLDISIPEVIVDMIGSLRKPTKKTRVRNATLDRVKGCQAIAKTELDLQMVAEKVGGDWRHLAEELGLTVADVSLVLNETCSDEDKAFMTLIQWQEIFGNLATGNELNRALRIIGREDVVKTCMGDISFVEDEDEAQSARERLKTDKSYHDDIWDDVMKPKEKPAVYSESVNESMIAETGDDWSELNKEEDKYLSDDERDDAEEDDKSLVAHSSHDGSVAESMEREVVVNDKRNIVQANVPEIDKTAAFLSLISEFDKTIPEPVLEDNGEDKTHRQAVSEQIVLKSSPQDNVKKDDTTSLSLLNLINCQVKESEVALDTVMDLDEFFPEPQETDEESLSEDDMAEYKDYQNDDQCVLEINIPGEMVALAPSNYEGFEITKSLLSMQNEELNADLERESSFKRSMKCRRNTEGRARLLEHVESVEFHEPISCLRRCYSVDIPRGKGRISFLETHLKETPGTSQLEDSSSDEDWNLEGSGDRNHPHVVIEELEEKEDSEKDTAEKRYGRREAEDWLNVVESSPVTDLDDISYSDDDDNDSYSAEEAEEDFIHQQPAMSCIPAYVDVDFEELISPTSAAPRNQSYYSVEEPEEGNLETQQETSCVPSNQDDCIDDLLETSNHHQPMMSCMPSNLDCDVDDEIIEPVKSSTDVFCEPISSKKDTEYPIKSDSFAPASTDLDFDESDTGDCQDSYVDHDTEYPIKSDSFAPASTDLDFDESDTGDFQDSYVHHDADDVEVGAQCDTTPPQSQRHSVLHEVVESEPQTQTEVEEVVEELPDGSILTRKIIKKSTSHTITEKTTREISPDEGEQLSAMIAAEPAQVVETEEVLEDGSIVRRIMTTTTVNSVTTSKSMSEEDFSPEVVEGSSSIVPSEATDEATVEVIEGNTKPAEKPKKRKNKKNKSKQAK